MPTKPSRNKTSWRFCVSLSCQRSANIASSSASFPILSSHKKELLHYHLVKTPVLTVLMILPGSCHVMLSRTCSMRLLNSLLDPSPLGILPWTISLSWTPCETTPLLRMHSLTPKQKANQLPNLSRQLVLLLVTAGIVTHKADYEEIPNSW